MTCAQLFNGTFTRTKDTRLGDAFWCSGKHPLFCSLCSGLMTHAASPMFWAFRALHRVPSLLRTSAKNGIILWFMFRSHDPCCLSDVLVVSRVASCAESAANIRKEWHLACNFFYDRWVFHPNEPSPIRWLFSAPVRASIIPQHTSRVYPRPGLGRHRANDQVVGSTRCRVCPERQTGLSARCVFLTRHVALADAFPFSGRCDISASCIAFVSMPLRAERCGLRARKSLQVCATCTRRCTLAAGAASQ